MKNAIANIKGMIFEIRGQKVMLDSDLAVLYGVEPRSLNQAVKRNLKRFPDDFMLKLTKEEFAEVITNCDHLQNLKFRSASPYVFTEQGVAMLATVLNSQKAIETNIQIMRAFIQLRNYVLSNDVLGKQIIELRKLLLLYIKKNDKRVNDIIIALNNLISHPAPTKKIGFRTDAIDKGERR